MKKINWKDIWTRAGKTFVQGFVGAITITPATFANVKDFNALRAVLLSLGIAGMAGGISAVWNYIKERLNKKEKTK